ncbi:histidine kinase [Microbacterium sp.]|uniref:histidine kinase n=1 Tax=Microbacterium sp. TaxID=51671 RepID=UPI003C7220D5
MTALLLVAAAALVVLGVMGVASSSLEPSRAVAAVACGVLAQIVAESLAVNADPVVHALASAAMPLVLVLSMLVGYGTQWPMVLAAVGATAAGPLSVVIQDPFHDPRCTVDCRANPLVLAPVPVIADVAYAAGLLAILCSLCVMPAIGDRRDRVLTLPFLVSWWLCVAAQPSGSVIAAALAVVVIGSSLVHATTRSARLGEAVAALTTADDADRVLAGALGTDAISLAYPTSEGVFVDARGRPMAVATHAVDVVGPDGRVVQLRGDLRMISRPMLARTLRGPARLALENRRLAAEAAYTARRIEESAGRLVAAAARGRRTLERDLHDGAQQHVLTLGLAIRAAPELDAQTRQACAEMVRLVLDQLRAVAHGIRPPQLDSGGLQHAWSAVGQHSPVPVELSQVPTGVDTATSELAYRLLVTCTRSATGPVVAAIEPVGADWRVTVTAAAGGGMSSSTADIVRALGGRLISVRVGPGWRHHAWLPRSLK